MFSILRKSLSGGSQGEPESGKDLTYEDSVNSVNGVGSADEVTSPQAKNGKSGKCTRSGDAGEKPPQKHHRRNTLAKSKAMDQVGSTEITNTASLPAETPEWGIKLLEIIQAQFNMMNTHVGEVEVKTNKNSEEVEKISLKLTKVEKLNKVLEEENTNLKEKLLDLEYRQRRNNLIFDGIHNMYKESEAECVRKLRFALKGIPGLDWENFKVEQCHRLDGLYNPSVESPLRIICCFNWYQDLQLILKHRKHLPRDVFVNEDLPEDWVDRCCVLKPIYNAAKRSDQLKLKTHFTKDTLVIDGKTFTPENVIDANKLLDVQSTCQKVDEEKIIFLGMHSVYSNFHPAPFSVDNVRYVSAEQMIKSKKAEMFGDDITQVKIMHATNPFQDQKVRLQGAKLFNGALEEISKEYSICSSVS